EDDGPAVSCREQCATIGGELASPNHVEPRQAVNRRQMISVEPVSQSQREGKGGGAGDIDRHARLSERNLVRLCSANFIVSPASACLVLERAVLRIDGGRASGPTPNAAAVRGRSPAGSR